MLLSRLISSASLMSLTACAYLNPAEERISNPYVEPIVTMREQVMTEPPTPHASADVRVESVPLASIPRESDQRSSLDYSSTPYGVDPIPAIEEPEADSGLELASIETPGLPDRGALQSSPNSSSVTLSADDALAGPVRFTLDAPPAVVALEDEVRMSFGRRNFGEAASALERAIRLQPKNPELWHALARIRLEQKKSGLAEDLAKKSNQLAKGNQALIRSNWRLIALARKGEGDWTGALAAEDKARW